MMRNFKVGFFSDSFDPFTFADLDVIKQALCYFDLIMLRIEENSERTYNAEIMEKAITEVIKKERLFSKVAVSSGKWLSYELAKRINATAFIRVINQNTNFLKEDTLGRINFENSGLETIYFRSNIKKMVHHSTIRELVRINIPLNQYFSDELLKSYFPKEILKVIT